LDLELGLCGATVVKTKVIARFQVYSDGGIRMGLFTQEKSRWVREFHLVT
jgi:hypothetical protein